ncbi:hypothetical protein [Christensenella minuta]|uniref:hypothetical protein n=1 Tax=Christensenella minuta TaxID=626937 RepID=UPI0021572507|nr:hypothetical protein [Christensenella minuta]
MASLLSIYREIQKAAIGFHNEIRWRLMWALYLFGTVDTQKSLWRKVLSAKLKTLEKRF